MAPYAQIGKISTITDYDRAEVTKAVCGICNVTSQFVSKIIACHSRSYLADPIVRRDSREYGPYMVQFPLDPWPITAIVCKPCYDKYQKEKKMLNDKQLSAIDRAFICEEPVPRPKQISVTDNMLEMHDGDNVLSSAIRRIAEQRRKAGIKKYGHELTTNNGRNPWNDACQECFDLCAYLHQGFIEDTISITWLNKAKELLKAMIVETLEKNGGGYN